LTESGFGKSRKVMARVGNTKRWLGRSKVTVCPGQCSRHESRCELRYSIPVDLLPHTFFIIIIIIIIFILIQGRLFYRFAPETADLGGLWTVDRSRTSGVGRCPSGSLDSSSSTARKFSPTAFSASVQRHGYSASKSLEGVSQACVSTSTIHRLEETLY
jgi:hypothetical protein